MLSHFRVICLLNYLLRALFIIQKNFRSLCTSLIKLVHMIVVQFSMSFVIRFQALAISLFIISHSLPFVKGFSKLFFKFFSKSVSFEPQPRLAQPLYYITSTCVCQEVFENFLKFFLNPTGSAPVFWTALLLYHISPTFVNTFFESFFRFFAFFSISAFPPQSEPALPLERISSHAEHITGHIGANARQKIHKFLPQCS